MIKKKQERVIESYPTRQMRLDEKTWERLKAKKLLSGLTWEKFFKDLLDKKLKQ